MLHHISPAMVGLGIGIAATLPGIGVLTSESTKKINFFIFLFMGATISMGGALRETQMLQLMADGVFRHLTPYVQEVSHSALVLYWLAFVSHLLLASQTANIAVTLPVVMDYAREQQLESSGRWA